MLHNVLFVKLQLFQCGLCVFFLSTINVALYGGSKVIKDVQKSSKVFPQFVRWNDV